MSSWDAVEDMLAAGIEGCIVSARTVLSKVLSAALADFYIAWTPFAHIMRHIAV